MQISPINNTQFGAKIVPSDYLNKAIDLAKRDAASGTEEGKKRAATFFNSLRTIELDATKKELSISDSNKKLPPILNFDGTHRFVSLFTNRESISGLEIQESINSMAADKYFRNEIKNYAENVNLSNAFDKWLA